MPAKFQRILIKLSGEYLGGMQGFGFDFSVVTSLTNQISQIHDQGIEIAIVLGGGNFFRGTRNIPLKMDRVAADHIGMLSTLMNSICLKESFLANKRKARIMTALATPEVAESFEKSKAVKAMMAGEILILAGGTGNPYFSTDTAAVLRGLQIEADIVIKGTKVDGVYDKDPVKYKSAKKFEDLTFSAVLEKDLKVMDSTAIALCRENQFPLCVLSISNESDLIDFILGKKVGTLIRF